MIDTLPDDLKPRVAEWFENARRGGNFDWKALIQFFRETFADKQAQQSASELVNRMEQGLHQYFIDFLQEFEYRMKLSGGEAAYTSLGKTQLLKSSINCRLRRALVGVGLPPPEDYTGWVTAVKEVALDLESLADYRPKGAAQTSTRFGASKGGTLAPTSTSRSSIDADGDIAMEGMDQILAALRQLIPQSKQEKTSQTCSAIGGSASGVKNGRSEKEMPRAPWRSRDEFRRLLNEGRCIRCASQGHLAKNCTVYRRPRRPAIKVNAIEESETESLVGKEVP